MGKSYPEENMEVQQRQALECKGWLNLDHFVGVVVERKTHWRFVDLELREAESQM